MTDHLKLRQAIKNVDDIDDIAAAIDKCNLRKEHKILLKILYVDGGRLDDVCDAVEREYTTISKWHKPALIKLIYMLEKQGKIKVKK